MDYLKIYNILDSTNKEAHRLLAEGPVLKGTTLLARHQTEGKGQYGRSWNAEPGSHLAMTIIFQPDHMSTTDLPALGMKVSLAIVRTLLQLDPALHPLVKWPNDIYIQDKKLCGLLIENSLAGTRVQHAVIGIGMNVNETQFPPEIPNAVSLYMITGKEYDILKIGLMVREQTLTLLEKTDTGWKKEYNQYVFGKGNQYLFESKGVKFHAVVLGVSLSGELELKSNDGTSLTYVSHEVKWIRY